MKVATSNGKTFALKAEDTSDEDLLDALHTQRVAIVGRMTLGAPDAGGGRRASGIELHVDRQQPGALVGDAGREAVESLRNLFCLAATQQAFNRHVRADAADPQPQEALPAVLEDLQLVLKTLGSMVVKLEAVVKKVDATHAMPSAVADEATSVGRNSEPRRPQ